MFDTVYNCMYVSGVDITAFRWTDFSDQFRKVTIR